MFCRSFCPFVFFFVIAFSVLGLMAFDYPFGIFKHFLRLWDWQNTDILSLWIKTTIPTSGSLMVVEFPFPIKQHKNITNIRKNCNVWLKILFFFQVCHANPSERARFIRCIYNLLNSSSPAVKYEAAGTLVTLSSAPTAVKVNYLFVCPFCSAIY
jgi:hypothetical protein